MSRRALFIVASVVLGGLALWAATYIFEPVEESVDRGFDGEAAVNPYLAFEETLDLLGIPTRSVSGLPQLPPTDHVLVIAAPHRGSGLAGAERLLGWAEEGGHLVVLPVGFWGEDPLVESAGVTLFDETGADDDDHLSRPDFASDRPAWPLLYHNDERTVLRSEGEEDAAWMLTLEVGEGAVTVLSDGAFLRNDALVNKDHALIGWVAVSLGGEPPAGVWIVFRDPMPSLTSLIRPRHRPALISLAVLVVIGLAMLARRRGPLLEPVPRERRQFAEHLRATGAYLWAVEAEDDLLDATRQALRRRLAHGNARGADASLQDLLPASDVGNDAVLWNDALTLRDCRDPKRFTRIIRYLETSRRTP